MAVDRWYFGTTDLGLSLRPVAHYRFNPLSFTEIKNVAPLFDKGLLMITELPVTTIAHAIQLAVAPVFLLTGVASILSVLTNRLGRIIDRSRLLHGRSVAAVETEQATLVELKALKKRARLIHLAIGLCTGCLLLICSVVAVLFLGSFITFSIEMVIAALFVAAMLCLIVALVYFICEIFLATAHVRGEP